MQRRQFLALFAASAASTGLLTSCANSSRDADGAPVPPPVPIDQLRGVTLRVGDQKGESQSLLRSAGLDDFPYKVEWKTFTSGPPLLEALSAEAIDLGDVGNTPPLFAAASKAKIKVVAAAKGNVISDAVLVTKDSPVRSLAELRGKKIAVAKGSSAHGQILLNLRKIGLTPDDVQLTFLQPSDARSAFSQSEVDAWAVWDPYYSQVLLETGARVLVDGTGIANGLSFQVASPAALADGPKNSVIADYLVRLAKAQIFSDQHREERAQAWSQDTGLPIEVTRRATALGPDVPTPLDQTVIDSSQELADAFVEAKEIPSRFDFAEYVDRRFEQQLAAVK